MYSKLAKFLKRYYIDLAATTCACFGYLFLTSIIHPSLSAYMSNFRAICVLFIILAPVWIYFRLVPQVIALTSQEYREHISLTLIHPDQHLYAKLCYPTILAISPLMVWISLIVFDLQHIPVTFSGPITFGSGISLFLSQIVLFSVCPFIIFHAFCGIFIMLRLLCRNHDDKTLLNLIWIYPLTLACSAGGLVFEIIIPNYLHSLFQLESSSHYSLVGVIVLSLMLLVISFANYQWKLACQAYYEFE